MTDLTPDELAARIAKLPAWARKHIAEREEYIVTLETLTRTLHAQLTEAQKDTTRAIGAAQPVPAPALPGGITPPADGYAVARVFLPGDPVAIADLPDTAEIAFAQYFRVRYGDTPETAGARVLVVEGDGALILRAAGPAEFHIARG